MATDSPDSKIAQTLASIGTAEYPQDVRFSAAYAIGYIDALYDAKLITGPEVQCHRDDAQTRRARRLTELGVGDQG